LSQPAVKHVTWFFLVSLFQNPENCSQQSVIH
jgi:hypothetical protein